VADEPGPLAAHETRDPLDVPRRAAPRARTRVARRLPEEIAGRGAAVRLARRAFVMPGKSGAATT
jgi:hypothetical protein